MRQPRAEHDRLVRPQDISRADDRAATEMPTGWHVIGHTDFRNFDPAGEPPTRLGAGDVVTFEAVP